MSGLGDWLARGVTYVGVLEGELSDDMGTLGEEDQTQVVCDELVPLPPTTGLDDRVRRTVAEQHDEISALKAENARLRELVVDMCRCITYDHDCTDCVINGESCDASILCGTRMRELGIEVDA